MFSNFFSKLPPEMPRVRLVFVSGVT